MSHDDDNTKVTQGADTDDNDISTILLKFEVSSMGLGNGDPFVVRVKPKTKWEKVISAFGRQFGVNVNAYRFSYDGDAIRWNEKQKVGNTLSGISKDEATEGIVIDVHAEAIGGSLNLN